MYLNTKKVTLVKKGGGGNFEMNYVFASYIIYKENFHSQFENLNFTLFFLKVLHLHDLLRDTLQNNTLDTGWRCPSTKQNPRTPKLPKRLFPDKKINYRKKYPLYDIKSTRGIV